MKTCEEMTRCVLEARDRYLIRRQKQRRIALRCTGTAVFCCAAVLVAYPLLSGRQTHEESGLTGDVTTGNISAAATTAPDELSGSPNSGFAGAVTDSPSGGLDGDVTSVPFRIPNGGAVSMTQTVQNQTSTAISTTEEKTVSQTVPLIADETEPPVIITEPTDQNTKKPVNTAPPETTWNEPEQLTDHDGNLIPHWDEKSFDQKYGWAGFGELGEIATMYAPTHETVDSEQIGELLGKMWLGGYDEYTDEYKHVDAEAYAISGVDTASEIAVKSPDEAQYYLFRIFHPLSGEDIHKHNGGDGN